MSRRAAFRAVALSMTAALGCGDPPKSPPPGPAPRPAKTEETAPPTPEGKTVAVDGGRVQLKVPADWIEAPEDQRASFGATARRMQPGLALSYAMTCPPSGCDGGMLIGVDETYAQPDHVYGWSVDEVADWSRTAPNGHGQPPTNATVTSVGSGRDVALQYPSGGRVRKRRWGHAGGLVELSCFCRGTGCEAIDGCALADPPTDAMPADAPLHGTNPPRTIEIPEIGTVQIPPGFVEATPEQLAPMRPVEHRPPFVHESGFVPQAKNVYGMVSLTHQTIEVASCDAKARADDLHGLVGAEVTAAGDAWDVVYGDLARWAHRRIWCEGDLRHTISCDCVGTPCAITRRTCELAGDSKP